MSIVNQYNLRDKFSQIATIILILAMFYSLTGCANVPVRMSLENSKYNVNKISNTSKSNKSVALVITEKFTNFKLKSIHKNMNMTYDFESSLGKDLSKTFPELLKEKFVRVTTVSNEPAENNYDITIIPNINKSRINTRLSTGAAQEPFYAIEINLEVIAKKNDLVLLNTTIKSGAEHKTEIACWTCLGAEVLDQEKIHNEYKLLLQDIHEKINKAIGQIPL